MKELINLLYILVMYGLSISYIPQIFRIARQKHVEGISLIMFIGFEFIQLSSMVHGYYTHNITMFYSMALASITCLIVALQIIYYRIKN